MREVKGVNVNDDVVVVEWSVDAQVCVNFPTFSGFAPENSRIDPRHRLVCRNELYVLHDMYWVQKIRPGDDGIYSLDYKLEFLMKDYLE